MDTVCSDCHKVLGPLKIAATCDMCNTLFCEKHSKQGPKNSKICRFCYIRLTKRKILKELSENPAALQKELSALKSSKSSSKHRLDKKLLSLKNLKCQLSVMKTYHKDLVKALKRKLESSQVSNKALEQVSSSLLKARSDISDCLGLRRKDLQESSEFLSNQVTEKLNLTQDLLKIRKLFEALLISSKTSVTYSRLQVLCCSKCLKKVKSEFRKQASGSALSSSSVSGKSSNHSLPDYPLESCKCFIS